jgi:hypothetical protein
MIQTEEIQKIKDFIKEYNEIHFNLDLMQKSIESLAEKRDKLFEHAEELKVEELQFLDELRNKYGEENITPNKLMQYIND